MALPNNPTQAQVVNEVKTLDNNAVYNAGALSTVAGSSTSGSVLSVRWYNSGINGITTPYDGMKIMIKIPLAGVSTGGVILSLNGNNANDYHPVAYNVSTVLTSHYAVGSYKIFTYDASATMTCYKTAGTAITVTGVWKGEANYDSNNYAYVRQYQHGANAAGTSPKYPILTRYNLTNKNGTYDTAYTRFRTDVTIDTSTGNLDAPTISENGTALSSKYLGIGATAADSTKLDGQASSYYLDYNNFTNTPSLGTASSRNTGTASGNVPVLDSNGKLDSGILPAIAITDTFVVNSQSAMLALTAEVGDVCVRTDLNKSYILKTAGASTLTNWQELLTPPNAVISVNGKTGAVSLSASDVSALPITGGQLTGPLYLAGGDAASGVANIQLDTNGQITAKGTTSTLFGRSNTGSTLLVGHSSHALTLRGSATRPTYNGNALALSSDIPSAITSVDGLSGGTISGDTTINGNLDAHYVKSTWLYTSAATDNASWTDVYVNNAGWLYKRSKSGFKSDLGVPSDGVVNATASTNVKRDSSGNVNAVAFDLCSAGTSTVNAKMLYDSTNECIKFTF